MNKIEEKKRRRCLPKHILDVQKVKKNPVSAMKFCGAASDDFPTFDEIRSSRIKGLTLESWI